MRFDRLARIITYLLVATSFSVLALSGELGPEFNLIFGPLFVLSVPLSRRDWARSVRGWNTVLVVGLGLAVALAILQGDWLRWAIYFASLMVSAKLFQQRTSTDFFQLYLLSFLQLVAGAVVNPTLMFAVAFLLYVVLITWALVLLHLRRDLEQVALRDHGGSVEALMGAPRLRRLITPGFLGGTSLLALGIFFASITVFLFFPRLGLGLFGTHRQSGQSVSGFDDSIELGGFGTIKSDQSPVMRVESDMPVETLLPLRLRGIVFDQYDGRRWTKTGTNRDLLRRTAEGNFFAVRREPRALPDGALRYELRVFLESIRIDKKTIFGEHRIVAVRDINDDRYMLDPRRRTKYYTDEEGDVLYESPSSDALRYVVRSIRYARDDAALRAAARSTPEESERYLQLPKNLDPRITALARSITAGIEAPFDQAVAIERYLTATYQYSLAGGQDETDPLADFLFGVKAGHCEFFSTAMVILARSVGIPARAVGGFYGGVYNSVGEYAVIRQADAHSWAELLFPGQGWEVFDATPASGALAAAEEGLFARIGRFFDSLEMLWYKTVVRFDLDAQIQFFRDLGKRFRGIGNVLPSMGDWKKWTGSARGAVAPVAGGMAGLLVVAFGVWLWRRRKRRAVPRPVTLREQRLVRKLYERLERAARRRGVAVGPSTTPGRLLAALRSQSPWAAEQAAPVIALYEEVMFGAGMLTPQALDQARARLAAVASSANSPAPER